MAIYKMPIWINKFFTQSQTTSVQIYSWHCSFSLLMCLSLFLGSCDDGGLFQGRRPVCLRGHRRPGSALREHTNTVHAFALRMKSPKHLLEFPRCWCGGPTLTAETTGMSCCSTAGEPRRTPRPTRVTSRQGCLTCTTRCPLTSRWTARTSHRRCPLTSDRY